MRTTVLAIDTATARGSVALARRDAVLISAALTERGAHARDLLHSIDVLLADTGLGPGDLQGVVTTLGPGSFTGVRVGLATAKGLAYALDIGLAGLSTLDAMARAAILEGRVSTGVVCVAIEAGRGEVYAASFRVEGEEPIRETTDLSYRPVDLARGLPAGAFVVGDASASIARAAREAGRELVVVESWPLLAGALALWGGRTLPAGARYRPGQPRPNYVRPSDAEAHRR